MIAALLLTTTILVGWTIPDGQPVTMTVLSVDEVKASPAFATMIRNRNAHRLVELRAAERVEEAPAGRSEPPTVIPASPPGLIQWRSEVERWRPLVSLYFQPGEVEHALALIRCESVGQADAINDSASDPAEWVYGLFQHKARYWPSRSTAAGWAGADILNPEANVAVAAHMVWSDGWWHWSGRAWGVTGCEEWAQAQLTRERET